jgi:hypothetical protein
VDPKGNKVIITDCMNATYKTMVASLLYYNEFCSTLSRLRFKPSAYEACVHNRFIRDKQQTVCFHVDDLKASHADAAVNDKLAKALCEEYEHILEDGTGQMTVHRWEVHKYLGITLDYSTAGLCKVSMAKYTKEILKQAEQSMNNCMGNTSSAAPKNLF